MKMLKIAAIILVLGVVVLVAYGMTTRCSNVAVYVNNKHGCNVR